MFSKLKKNHFYYKWIIVFIGYIFLLYFLRQYYVRFKAVKLQINNLRRVARDSTYGDFVVSVYKSLVPKDVLDRKLVRIGPDGDGGYVMVDDFNSNNIAYSLGIEKDVSWDLAMAEKGIEIYMYDHTIDSLPLNNEHFHFFKVGVCGFSGCENKQLKTLESILAENDHLNNHHLILKMDIDDDEWDVILNTSTEILSNFEQITLEYHSLDNFDKLHHNKMIAVFSKLNKNHQVVHVHANNFELPYVIGGFIYSSVLEVSYLRRYTYISTNNNNNNNNNNCINNNHNNNHNSFIKLENVEKIVPYNFTTSNKFYPVIQLNDDDNKDRNKGRDYLDTPNAMNAPDTQLGCLGLFDR
jgi:hypothetical protein